MQLPDDSAGQRLDHVLTRLTDYPRGRIQQLLKDGAIQVNQRAAKASFRVRGGEMVYIPEAITKTLNLQPEAIPLDVLYEDEALLVVNKPAGMVVHPSCGHETGTLVHALLHHCVHLPGINGVERPGIVHRLDKDSSGALVVAKTNAAHIGLSNLFARHDIQREYLAWCRGAPPWPQKRIETMIGRHPHHRQKMSVLPEHSTRGKLAITDACREQVFNHGFSRMRLTLHTGRTHQIRVHLADVQLPILGDTVYARSFNPAHHLPDAFRAALHALRRQALHAEVLGFIHPISHQSIDCVAQLPCDLKDLDAALQLL